MSIRYWLLAAMLAGCGGPTATASDLASPSSSVSRPQSTPLPSADASESSDPSLPPMPAGFPVHEAMEEQEPDAGTIAGWTAGVLPSKLYSFYLRELPAAGFTITLEGPGGEAAIIRFAATDGTPYQLDLVGRFSTEVSLGPPHD